ncbi:MAG TPA: hypothetical protein VMV22_07945 [Acidimicrobiales bacterium]|nr:hypothetical protein [Acidimicrobiales bacterium]
MSSLWTPDGEHRVRPTDSPAAPPTGPPGGAPPGDAGAGSGSAPGAGGGAPGAGARRDDPDLDDVDLDDLGPEEQAALASRLDELRRQLLGTPAEVVVANHAYGLFELAAIHLSQQPPGLDQARLAVDAMGSLVEGMAGRLGDAETSLRDALAQIRLAFVEIGGPPDADGQP